MNDGTILFWKKEKKTLMVAAILLIIFLLPPFLLGENTHIREHDNLDSNIAWYKVLNDSGQLFGPIDSTIPQIINGLPRNAFGTEFSGIQWLYEGFSPIVAYALSQSITRIFAFIGMYLLLRRHFVRHEDAYQIRVWVALAFALTPFWPSGMLSTLGQPLALWAFLNIREKKSSWKEWLTLSLLPFYSSFVLGFFFFLVAIGLLWLRDGWVKKDWNLRFLLSIALMTVIFLGIEYRLVVSLLFPTAPTSRNEFVSSTLGFWHSVRLAGENYLLGHTHVMTLHTPVIFPLTLIVIWFFLKDKLWKKEKRYVSLFILNIVLSIWYAFWFYKGWEPLKEKVGLLNTFNFARFHFLRPLIIYMMYAVGSVFLWNRSVKWKQFVKMCLVLQIFILFCANPEVYYRVAKTPSFEQFYAENEFNKIDEYIGKPKSSYRVASIGIHPAIAQYNGFYTLDTYNNFYPLSYKHQFRKIIAHELDKNNSIKKYFDTWGGRCYLFVAELGKNYDFKKDSTMKIHHLDLNMNAFKNMGGQYIFSAVPILNGESDGLHFLKSFTDKDSAWKIYLYKAK
ncbi:DUF6044 family protein [Neobacillus sp. PS3-40]|uniref:DUF6044 family protein n=1 Tax=Neobacillus sp. PS3-40 TaxID=3070679 RepID=UPI0027E0D497|nr:DUF6044 family protein [Neobacillus sp. PS3-40]WML43466.1 DUF6044 family protein [Neobacillus sp. PS3-40]